MINWPNTLVADVARRNAVIVLGAGVSANATNASGQHPVAWSEFLRKGLARMTACKALKKEVKDLIAARDFLTACEVIKNSVGMEAFGDLVREEYVAPQFRHARVHEVVAQLDARLVITPNFDTVYETYVASAQGNSVTVKNYRDADLAEAVRLPGRVILKIHGTVHSPREMVFTRSDYARARTRYQACYALLSALLLTHTFLFIGCGLADPDMALLLEDYAFQYMLGRAHYMTIPRREVRRTEVQTVIESTRGLRMLPYDDSHAHRELLDSLEDLVNQVNVERQSLSQSQNW